MRPRHRVSRNAIDLIERFEGYRRKAAALPDGRWTIGYGHTLTAREGAEVSEEDAEALLIYDLIAVAHAVNEHVFTPLNQNQFDALCSFAFNLGLDSFRRSQVLKRLNEGEVIQAACAMELWRKAEFQGQRIVIDALVRRRAAEKALFLTPPDGVWIPAPSPLLRPLADIDARDLIPSERPTGLVTSLEGEQVLVSRDGEPVVVPPPVEDEAPGETVRAAAEAVTSRLQAIFPEAGSEFGEEAAAVRPQADFASPITTSAEGDDEAVSSEAEAASEALVIGSYPEEAPQPPETAQDLAHDLAQDLAAPEPANDARLVSPPEPQIRMVIDDTSVHDFIPARVTPLPRKREPGLGVDVVLALLGLAFFGFGLFWGLNARGAPVTDLASPLVVAWAAGIAGVGFFVVAVFRLLERLARISERD
ncbi:lysozyme [Phenylobacterium sp.]|uniref:lysozyme n=1 Tax=Phenylobacterium sp. TaxID=1871053 RepID=UPI00391B6ACE